MITSPHRQLSGFKPTGPLQLGNHLSAIRPLVRASTAAAAGADPRDVLVMVADLHALTVPHGPARLRSLTREVAAVSLAAGLDLDRSTLFVQSQVGAHRAMHYLLEGVATAGEVSRMVQFKDKSRRGDGCRLALLSYPVLMAADILLYGVAQVPVGADQTQHLELARSLAARANRLYDAGFVVPEGVEQAVGHRLMDLQNPTVKMDKTNPSPNGVLYVLDPPDVLRRKVSRAVTDTGSGPDAVRYDRAAKPGVANLLEIMAACTGLDPCYAARGIDSYRELKECVAETVVATLLPVQRRHAELDPRALEKTLAEGAARARDLAGPVLERLEKAMGLGQ